MTVKSVKTQQQHEVLPFWKLRFFEAGILDKVPEFDAYYVGADWIYHTALDPDPVRTEWPISRKKILKSWIAAHPGTRPYAWWCYDAPEVRQRVGVSMTSAGMDSARTSAIMFGIPRYWVTQQDIGILTRPGFRGKPVDSNDPPLFESQTAYLERHGLLTDAEKATLPGDAYDLEIVVCGNRLRETCQE